MGQWIYKPSAVKPFREFAEGLRRRAKELKKMEKEKGLHSRESIRAEILEEVGKELKELASDVLNDRQGII